MKKFKLLFLFLILPLFSGCISYTELNQLGIISLLGIDYTEEGYHLYINLIEGNQDDGVLEKKYVAYDAVGESFDEAWNRLYLKSNKKLYLSHMDTLLLTDSLIDRRLKETITYLLNHPEVRNNFEIALIDSEIENLFEEHIEAKEINDLIHTNQKYMGTTKSITFEKFLGDLLIDKNSVLPLISYQEKLEIEGLTLIKDFQILDTLSPEETILLNILNNQINQTIYHNTSIYKNETLLEYQKRQITFQIQIETGHKEKDFEKNLEQELKRLLYFYQSQNYDLIKLEYKMKQNHLFDFQNSKLPFDQVKLKFQIQTQTIDNYLEKELST